jgi:hypothetical protein
VQEFNDLPVAQNTGVFSPETGLLARWDPVANYLGTEGTTHFRVLRQRDNASTDFDDLAVVGSAKGNTHYGWVVYLGGHEFSTDPTQNTSCGTRMFLNALLFAPVTALDDGAPVLTNTLVGRPCQGTPQMDLTNTVRNLSAAPALNTQVAVDLPAGTTASLISSGGSVVANQIVWNLGTIGASNTVRLTFQLIVAEPGAFTVTSTADYFRGNTPARATASTVVNYSSVGLSGRFLTNQLFELSATGSVPCGYVVEASADLSDWATLTVVPPGVNPWQFVDPQTGNRPQRYYRLRWP